VQRAHEEKLVDINSFSSESGVLMMKECLYLLPSVFLSIQFFVIVLTRGDYVHDEFRLSILYVHNKGFHIAARNTDLKYSRMLIIHSVSVLPNMKGLS
jgi:hypothetical protein